MNKRVFTALTIGLAAPAFVLSRVIWPDPVGAVRPPGSLLPFLVVPAVVECLALGAGVAFLVATGRALVSTPSARRLDTAACASAGWALVSWWPHSNLHRVNTTFQGLVVIDWFFHLTLIAGAVVVVVFVSRTLGLFSSAAAPGQREAGPLVRSVPDSHGAATVSQGDGA